MPKTHAAESPGTESNPHFCTKCLLIYDICAFTCLCLCAKTKWEDIFPDRSEGQLTDNGTHKTNWVIFSSGSPGPFLPQHQSNAYSVTACVCARTSDDMLTSFLFVRSHKPHYQHTNVNLLYGFRNWQFYVNGMVIEGVCVSFQNRTFQTDQKCAQNLPCTFIGALVSLSMVEI